jgi:hypothetical protein
MGWLVAVSLFLKHPPQEWTSNYLSEERASSRLCHSFAAWPSGVSHCSAIPPILSVVEDFDSPQLSEFMKSILEA